MEIVICVLKSQHRDVSELYSRSPQTKSYKQHKLQLTQLGLL